MASIRFQVPNRFPYRQRRLVNRLFDITNLTERADAHRWKVWFAIVDGTEFRLHLVNQFRRDFGVSRRNCLSNLVPMDGHRPLSIDPNADVLPLMSLPHFANRDDDWFRENVASLADDDAFSSLA